MARVIRPLASPLACSRSLSSSPCCSRPARTIASPAASVGDGEISNDQLHARRRAASASSSALSGSPCGHADRTARPRSPRARGSRSRTTSRRSSSKAYAADARPRGRGRRGDRRDRRSSSRTSGAPTRSTRQLADAGITRAGPAWRSPRGCSCSTWCSRRSSRSGWTRPPCATPTRRTSPQFTTRRGRAHPASPTKPEAEQIAAEVTPENFAEAREARLDRPRARRQNGGSLGSLLGGAVPAAVRPDVRRRRRSRCSRARSPASVETQFGWHVIELVRRDVPTVRAGPRSARGAAGGDRSSNGGSQEQLAVDGHRGEPAVRAASTTRPAGRAPIGSTQAPAVGRPARPGAARGRRRRPPAP